MKKIFTACVISILLVSLFAGCARSSSKKDARHRVWIIATDTVFRPFVYKNPDGKLNGIDIDILRAVAEDQGFSYELRSLGWDAAVAAVMNGEAQALMAGATIKQSRIDTGWIFSEPYFYAAQTFVVPLSSTVSSFADLKGKTVAVKNGTSGADFAYSLRSKYDFKIKVFQDSPSMYSEVINGGCDALVEDAPTMADNIKKDRLPLYIPQGMADAGSPYGFVIMDVKNFELLEMFNAGLKNIMENGRYQKILEKYFQL
jgi:polar amino acid transport system substrate-binding protein